MTAPAVPGQGLIRRLRRRLGAIVAGPEARAPSALPPGRARRVGRAALRLLLALAAALVLVRLALPIALPYALSAAAGRAGLACSYERLDLSLLSGDLRLQGLTAAPKEGGPPVLAAGYVEVDLAPLDLLAGRLHVRRLELDGVEVLIERGSDGVFEIARPLARRPAPAGARKEVRPEECGAGGDPGLDALVLDQVRLNHLHVRFRDASVVPPLDARLDLDLRISDFDLRADRGARPGRLELSLRCPPVLDSLTVEATLRAAGGDACAALEIALDRLHPGPLASYLAPLGIRPAAGALSLSAGARARPHSGVARPGAGLAWDVVLEGLRADADGVEIIGLDRAALEVADIGPRQVEIARAALEGLRAAASRDPDGAIHLAGLRFVAPAPGSRAAPPAAAREMSAAPAGPAAAPAGPSAAPEASPGRRIVLGEVALEGVSAAFHDEAVRPAADLALILERALARDLVVDPIGPPVAAPIAMRLRAPGLAGAIAVTGTACLSGPRPGVELRVAAEDVHLRGLAPHLAAAGLEPALEQGRVGLTLRAAAATGAGGAAALEVAASDIVFSDGGEELAGIDLVRALTRADFRACVFTADEVEIVRPRTHGRRDAAGRVTALGVRTRARDEAAAAGAFSRAEEPGGDDGAATSWGERAPLFRVGRFAVGDAEARFDDEAVSPPARLVVRGLGLEAEGLEADLDPGAAPAAPGRFRAWLEAPGLAERVEGVGSLVPTPAAPSVRLEVTASGVSGRAAEGYLAAAGLAREIEDGRLEASLEAAVEFSPAGPVTARCSVGRLRLTDGGRELLALEGLRAGDLRTTGARGHLERIALESIELDRLRVAASRDESGAAGALGVRVRAPKRRPPGAVAAPQPAVAAAPSGPPPWPAAQASAAEAGPVVFLGRLHLGEVALEIEDRSGRAPLAVPVRAAADLGPLTFDVAGRGPPERTPFALTFAVPGAVESVTLTGGVALHPHSVRLDAALAARGITARSLRPALLAAGLEPVLDDGAFGLEVRAEAGFSEGVVTASAAIERLALVDGVGAGELLGVDAVRLDGLRSAGGEVSIDSIEVVRPRARAAREAAGTLVAAGFRSGLPLARAPSPAPAEDEVAAGAAPAAAAAAPARTAAGGSFELRRLRIVDARAALSDQTVGAPAPLEATAGLELTGAVVGRPAPPARLKALVRVPGALDSLALAGTITPDPGQPALEVALDLAGLRSGPLDRYLPPRFGIDLADGRFHAALRAGLGPHPEGGRRAEVVISDIRLADGGGPPLASVEAVRFLARRIDPAGGLVAIDDVSAIGIEGLVQRTERGDLRFAGLKLAAASPPAAAARTPAPAGAAVPPRPVPAAATPALEARHRPARLPQVEVERLLVDVRRLTYTDASLPGSKPLVLKDLELKNTDPLKALGPDPTANPYFALEVRAEIEPILRLVTATARFSPFAQEPEFSVRSTVLGVRGAGITEVRPDLAGTIDGRELSDGQGHIQIVLRGQTGRRDPLDYSFLETGFGFEFTIRRTFFRNGEKGPPLAAIQDFRLDVARVDPAARTIRVREVEIAKPAARILKDAAGTHLCGLIFKAPKPAPAIGPKAPKPMPTAGAPAAGPAAPEVLVERLTFTDIDFNFDDRSCEPPLGFPLTGLDVEVTGIDFRSRGVRQPTRFEMHARSGDVRLAKRAEKSFVPGMKAVTKMLGKVAEMAGAEKVREFEKRPLFGDLTAKGQILLGPSPLGEVRASIVGLELGDFAGAAGKSGVKLADGVLDLDVTARFLEGGRFELDADAIFTDLDLDEPADGPIASTLGLPAPLNAVLFALRDEDGAVDVPVRVRLEGGEVSRGAVTGAVARAILGVATDALANVGFRAVDTVSDLGRGILSLIPGLGSLPFFSEPEPVTVAPVVIAFGSGEPAPADAEIAKLGPLVETMKNEDAMVATIQYAVGGGDNARSRLRANPGPDDRRDLVARLAARKREVEGRRADLLAEARAANASGFEDRARTAAADLIAADRELADLETGLDRVLELERGGADRQSGRRGRVAGLELAHSRLERVRAALVAAGVPDPERRIQVARPRIEDAPGTGGGTVTVSAAQKKARK